MLQLRPHVTHLPAMDCCTWPASSTNHIRFPPSLHAQGRTAVKHTSVCKHTLLCDPLILRCVPAAVHMFGDIMNVCNFTALDAIVFFKNGLNSCMSDVSSHKFRLSPTNFMSCVIITFIQLMILTCRHLLGIFTVMTFVNVAHNCWCYAFLNADHIKCTITSIIIIT